MVEDIQGTTDNNTLEGIDMKKLDKLDKKKEDIPTLEQVKAALKNHDKAIKDKIKANKEKSKAKGK